MKSMIFACFNILCFAGSVVAQQGWVPLTSGTTATLNYISLIGPDTIYVSGQTAIRSTDGGATWDSLANMPSYQGKRMTSALVQFVDDSVGFLCGSADTIYKTTNGGQFWFANSATGLVGGNVPAAMSFKSRFFGCVLGSYSSGNSRTTDGGATWQVSGAYGDFNCMAFADTLHGFEMGPATGWLPDVTKPHAAAFEYTNDGGKTWNLSYAGPSVDGKHSGITKDVLGISAVSADTLFAVGEQIAKSTDAGNSWDTILYAGDGYNGFMAVTFPDFLHGTAVGSNGWIFHTNDGGLTWVKQNSGITDGSFLLAISFIDSLTGYAVGETGIILKTINGGQSWVQLPTGPTSMLEPNVYPQPALEKTFLSYNLSDVQHVTLSIDNITGAKMSTVLSGALQSAGSQTVSIDTSQWPAGTYTYLLQSEKYYATGKIEVVH